MRHTLDEQAGCLAGDLDGTVGRSARPIRDAIKGLIEGLIAEIDAQ
ncbi:hypothetical protein AB0D29_13765 [Streptomyces sp. NPDC048424]